MGLHLDALGDHPQITRLGWSEYTVYSQVIRGCDIILAPVLPDDGFNISKSPIKAVEGQAAERKVNGTSTGAAVIATNNPVYRLAIQDQDNGLLVSHTERAWYGAIKTLVEQDHTRVRLQDRGYKSAWKRFDITKEWKQWSVAYNTALSLKNSPVMSITEVNNNVP
jgi:glycosyltransferase involved in cell wall biosynthesis